MTGLQPSAMAPTLVTWISHVNTVMRTSALCLHFGLLLSVLINKLCVKAHSVVVSDCQPEENNITPLGTSESFSYFCLFVFVLLGVVCLGFCLFLWAVIGTSSNSNQNP